MKLRFQLGDAIVIESRTRYNIWGLLGDVGGFDSGMILLCKFFTTSYAAASFVTTFLGKTFYDSNDDMKDEPNFANKSVVDSIRSGNTEQLDKSETSFF